MVNLKFMYKVKISIFSMFRMAVMKKHNAMHNE